jgi:hypothetical protein
MAKKDSNFIRNEMMPRMQTWPIGTLQRHKNFHIQQLDYCDLDKEIGKHHHWWHTVYIGMIGEVLSQKL